MHNNYQFKINENNNFIFITFFNFKVFMSNVKSITLNVTETKNYNSAELSTYSKFVVNLYAHSKFIPKNHFLGDLWVFKNFYFEDHNLKIASFYKLLLITISFLKEKIVVASSTIIFLLSMNI